MKEEIYDGFELLASSCELRAASKNTELEARSSGLLPSYESANLFAGNDTTKVSFLIHIENYDRQIVLHA